MAKPTAKFRSRFSEPQRVVQFNDGKKITKQAQKDESNINTIVSRYMKTGQVPMGQKRQPIYGDISAVDFQTMQNTLIDAENSFAALPAKIRRRFADQPYQLLRFLDDPANKDEAIRLGLLQPPQEPPKPAEKGKEPEQLDLAKEAEKAGKPAKAQ